VRFTEGEKLAECTKTGLDKIKNMVEDCIEKLVAEFGETSHAEGQKEDKLRERRYHYRLFQLLDPIRDVMRWEFPTETIYKNGRGIAGCF
jgi:hypothetical protein